jgi:hypothetical protein
LLALACAGVVAGSFAPAGSAGVARQGSARSGPNALNGTWKRALTQADIDRTASFRVEPTGSTPPPAGPITLAIANGSFTFTDDTGFSIAQTTRIDAGGAFDVLTYVAPDKGAFCTANEPQNASYTWNLDGAKLVLTPVDDRCADRNSILAGRWTRASEVRTIVARQVSEHDRKQGFTFTEKLTEGGKPAGTDSGTCKYLVKKTAACKVTLRLTGGTLVVRGTLDLARPVAKLEIVSGTGAFAGAGGTITVKNVSDAKAILTIHFV